MTTRTTTSGSIYDTLFVSKIKKNMVTNSSRSHSIEFNLYDASQKKPGQLGVDRSECMPQQVEYLDGHRD